MRLLAFTSMLCLLPSCASVVPPDDDFAASRCSTVIDDGVEGLPTFEIGAVLEVKDPDGKLDFDVGYDLRAMRLAISQLNNGHDVAGKHFRMRICDTRADWSTGGGQVTRDLTTWLIDHEHVQAIISDASADTAAMAAVTLKKGVLMMAISSTAEDLTYLDDHDLVWRVAPSDVYQGAVLAHMVTSTVATDGMISVLYVDSPYGNGIADALKRQLKNRVQAHPLSTSGQGMETAVQAAAKDAPVALLIVANSKLAVQMVTLRMGIPALAATPLFLSDGACDSDLAQQTFKSGVSLAGARCTRPGQPPDDVYKDFQKAYIQHFALDPAKSSYTQHSFDVVYCLALAHAWATGSKGAGKATGAALAEGLKHLSSGDAFALGTGDISKMIGALAKGQDINIAGASGPLDFNPDTGEAPSGYESFTLGEHGQLTHETYYAVKDQGKDKGSNQFLVLPVAVTPTTP